MAQPANPRGLVFVKGDDETITVTITSDGSTPVNITGRTYVCSLSTAPGTAPSTTGSCSVTGASGLVTITFTDTQTDALAAGTTYWIDLVETSGSNESTLILAPVQCIARVTA